MDTPDIVYYGLIRQENAPWENLIYYFKLIGFSEEDLDESFEKWKFGGRLKLTLLRRWKLRGGKRFLEDGNLADSYMNRLNRGEITENDLPENLRGS